MNNIDPIKIINEMMGRSRAAIKRYRTWIRKYPGYGTYASLLEMELKWMEELKKKRKQTRNFKNELHKLQK
jgi:hypothetical protein